MNCQIYVSKNQLRLIEKNFSSFQILFQSNENLFLIKVFMQDPVEFQILVDAGII